MSMKHHAVCYVGESQARSELAHYFESTNPDVHVLTFGELGIADARELARRSSMTPLSAPQQVFLVTCKGLTHEAQNALLKLFEEPSPRTQFYVMVPQKGLLLPTLQSRLMIIEAPQTEQALENVAYQTFKNASLGERLEIVAEISKTNDSERIEAILLGVEREVVGRDVNSALQQTLMTVREHIARRGASKKMLLESLALTLPHN